MQVTIDIDGRKALPIRAIPYVCAWSYGAAPDDIVSTLAAPKTKTIIGDHKRLQHNELFAYQMIAQGKYEQIPPSQWGNLGVRLDSFTKKLQADEREGAENENRAPWEIKAILELPDNVFIWLDEFQYWYSLTRPLDTALDDEKHYAPEDDDEDGGRLKKLDDTLCLSPLIPPEIDNKLWRYAEYFFAATQQASSTTKVEAVTGATPAPAAKIETAPATSPSGNDWTEKARAIADECFDHDTNATPTVRDSLATKNSVRQITGGYCFRVMGIMQERGIKGPRGIITNPATIMREALQGKKWWANKPK